MKTYQLKLDTQKYSQYHVIAYVNRQLCVILIDTGACSSHVSRHFAHEIFEIEHEVVYTTFQGETVINNKATTIEMVFSKDLIINLDIMIDNRQNTDTEKILLGIDFLENFEYKITRKELILDGIAIPRIDMYYKDIESFIKHV